MAGCCSPPRPFLKLWAGPQTPWGRGYVLGADAHTHRAAASRRVCPRPGSPRREGCGGLWPRSGGEGTCRVVPAGDWRRVRVHEAGPCMPPTPRSRARRGPGARAGQDPASRGAARRAGSGSRPPALGPRCPRSDRPGARAGQGPAARGAARPRRTRSRVPGTRSPRRSMDLRRPGAQPRPRRNRILDLRPATRTRMTGGLPGPTGTALRVPCVSPPPGGRRPVPGPPPRGPSPGGPRRSSSAAGPSALPP